MLERASESRRTESRGADDRALTASTGHLWAGVRARGFRHFVGTVGMAVASILAGVLGAVDPGGLRHTFDAGGGAKALLAFTVVVALSSLAGGAFASWLIWLLGERSWRRSGDRRAGARGGPAR